MSEKETEQTLRTYVTTLHCYNCDYTFEVTIKYGTSTDHYIQYNGTCGHCGVRGNLQ